VKKNMTNLPLIKIDTREPDALVGSPPDFSGIAREGEGFEK
jgi:hypothetical protein